jgi:predicted metal-binding membrane protein
MDTLLAQRRADRTAVFGSLAALTVLAWVFAVQLAAGMKMPVGTAGMASAMPSAGHQFLLASAMWAAMMVGMMVPSATPMVVAYAEWTRRGSSNGSRTAAVGSFLAGYVFVWLGFGVFAAVVQVALEQAGLLTAMGTTNRPALGGALLVVAGVFQVTPWKESCLRRCRTPFGFLIAEWRDGAPGAVVMGIRHGAYCLGCCWLLMATLFVVGTMHLGWMAVIAVFVLAEKVTPRSLRISPAAAVVLVGWGAWSLWTAGALR